MFVLSRKQSGNKMLDLEDIGNVILMVSIVLGIALFTKVNADYVKEEVNDKESK